MICPRHGTPHCMTEATQRCAFDLIAENPDGMIQADVARHLGVDRTRIMQIEAMALRKLRRAAGRRGIDATVLSGPERMGAPRRRYGGAL